jgi:ribosomal protein L21E
MLIYIVEGDTGEYSGHSTWLVKAFSSKEKAEDLARNAMLRAKEIEKESPTDYLMQAYKVGDKVKVKAKKKNKFDPQMQMQYTGTEYTVLEVEFDPS